MQELGQADLHPVEILLPADSSSSNIHGPPIATVARRAKSYTDFYHVARAQFKKNKEKQFKHVKRSSRDSLKGEEFKKWPEDLSESLLNSSHERYMYGAYGSPLG